MGNSNLQEQVDEMYDFILDCANKDNLQIGECLNLNPLQIKALITPNMVQPISLALNKLVEDGIFEEKKKDVFFLKKSL